MPITRDEYLREFMQIYWLRPESAVFAAVKAHRLQSLPVTGRSLDLSCGDGLFSFISLGGRIAPEFDVFGDTGHLDRVRPDNADMFDYVSGAYAVPVLTRPPLRISRAIDMKRSMLAKASALGLYEDLVEHDCNETIPLPDGSVDTLLFFNTINHYRDADTILRSIARILSPGGAAYISILDPSLGALYDALEGSFPADWLHILERGLRSLWPIMMQPDGWRAAFDRAGLECRELAPLVDKRFIPVWSVGLRPLAPNLVELARAARTGSPRDFPGIKARWVDLMCDLARPFAHMEPAAPEDAGTYLAVLRKPAGGAS